MGWYKRIYEFGDWEMRRKILLEKLEILMEESNREENLKRKCTDALATGKQTKKGCRTFNGGPYEASQLQTEPKLEGKERAKFIDKKFVREEETVEQLLQTKPAVEVLQILEDGVDRIIMKDKMAHLSMMKLPEFYPQILNCPSLRTEIMGEWKHRLEKEKEMINSYEQWLQGTMSAFKQRYIVELEKMLFVENKKTVKFSNFQCLEEAVLETANGEIPKYLQDIACKIKNACGTKETENVPNINALILLCAAIHEMDQYMGVELLNWDRLLTWGATYNKAKDAGFKVEFIEKHLKKIWYAFIGSYLKTCGNNGNTELKMMEKCLSAEESFQGKPLSHGLFSQ